MEVLNLLIVRYNDKIESVSESVKACFWQLILRVMDWNVLALFVIKFDVKDLTFGRMIDDIYRYAIRTAWVPISIS